MYKYFENIIKDQIPLNNIILMLLEEYFSYENIISAVLWTFKMSRFSFLVVWTLREHSIWSFCKCYGNSWMFSERSEIQIKDF